VALVPNRCPLSSEQSNWAVLLRPAFPTHRRLSATQGGGTAAIVVSTHKGPSVNFLLFSAFPRAREGERDADADAGAGLSWAEQLAANKADSAAAQSQSHYAGIFQFRQQFGFLR
jgi:hypothetical protein